MVLRTNKTYFSHTLYIVAFDFINNLTSLRLQSHHPSSDNECLSLGEPTKLVKVYWLRVLPFEPERSVPA